MKRLFDPIQVTFAGKRYKVKSYWWSELEDYVVLKSEGKNAHDPTVQISKVELVKEENV